MSLYRPETLLVKDFDRAITLLGPATTGLTPTQTLSVWKRWHEQGAIFAGWVRQLGEPESTAIKSIGISLLLKNDALSELIALGPASLTEGLYQQAAAAVNQSATSPWFMTQKEIRQAHLEQNLNLFVLHFWTPMPWFPDSPDAAANQEVFLQSKSQFAATHQGFGVKRVLQEVPVQMQGSLEAGGFTLTARKVLEPEIPSAPKLVLMSVDRQQALSGAGSAMSFLFFSPASKLGLAPAMQRMLTLALAQRTDEDIAALLDCSRDYVRKLWSQIYQRMENQGIFAITSTAPVAPVTAASQEQLPRGRERRRFALEFFANNLQELRPGMPTASE